MMVLDRDTFVVNENAGQPKWQLLQFPNEPRQPEVLLDQLVGESRAAPICHTLAYRVHHDHFFYSAS